MSHKPSAPAGVALAELLQIMARLRDPEGGCPWDLEQDFASIAPYTLEEAYEVAEAIQRNDADDLRDELGDLLFQVVFHAQMAHEKGWFDFDDVVVAINRKLVRRHPHVFADEEIFDARAQTEAWEQHKASERAAKGLVCDSAVDGVPLAMPALVRAQKIQRRAARVGFDWDDIQGVVDKLEEELAELKQALDAREPVERVQEELGDLLFSGVNLARFLEADAESLLRHASHKFECRFRLVERFAQREQRKLQDCTLAELEAYWQAAKQQLAGEASSRTDGN
ncbi:MAG TPA: nucleoside triphosphate pyrophosphohydrolase [Gammaproteobacteria bacterium]|nr:nucleoside triphosphate pyrophosphohydrolase [Gammaproteobacteria bacterium]